MVAKLIDVTVQEYTTIEDVLEHAKKHDPKDLALEARTDSEGDSFVVLVLSRLQTPEEVADEEAWRLASFQRHVTAIKQEAKRLGLDIKEIVK